MVTSLKFVSKKVMIFLVVLTMLMPMVPAGSLPGADEVSVVQANTIPSVNIGDYIQFGSYNNAPILWRVIHKDANGNPILFADRILMIKAFDAAGSYHSETNRQNNGSNYYPDSNIRQWLNSINSNNSDDKIDWIQNDPTAINMRNDFNAYNTEKGFLAEGNFTETERKLIKPFSHKTVLSEVDQLKRDGGTKTHYYTDNILSVLSNYDTNAYYKNINDRVFLLSVKQIKEWVYDRGYSITAKPTPELVSHTRTIPSMTKPETKYDWWYWLNTPSSNSSYAVRTVSSTNYIGSEYSHEQLVGIRPALQLDISSVMFTSFGIGSISNPLVVSSTSLAPTDAIKPSPPTNLDVINLTSGELTLKWLDSTDNIGVIAYQIYQGGILITTIQNAGGVDPPHNVYTITGLSEATTYDFTVKSKDFAGNVSDSNLESTIKITTKKAPWNIKIGDYIQFGKYNNAPIIWRVIHRDLNGDPILFSDRILSLKAFDAPGSYHPNGLYSFGFYGDMSRYYWGSNYYPDSNIRQWLNSERNLIDWIQNDPNSNNLCFNCNPYSFEKGFLADGNFTLTERSYIKPLENKVILSKEDWNKKDGGHEEHIIDESISNVIKNYDNSIHKNITDSVFLLSVKQIKEWVYDNRSVLGNNYHISKPTPEAVVQSRYKNSTYLNSNSNWSYWLSTPWAAKPDCVRVVKSDGSIDYYQQSAYGSSKGIRPAVKLNISSIILKHEGSGTLSDPYIIWDGISDIQKPTPPFGLTLSKVEPTSFGFSWMPSTDNIGVTAYEIYNGETLIATVTGSGGGDPVTTYSALGLTAGTTYSLSIKARDAAGNVSLASHILTVTTKAPPVNIQLNVSSITENAGANAVVGILSATDADAGDTATFTLVSGEGDTNNSSFTIDGTSLKATVSFDYETKSSYSIRVRATDGDGATYEKQFTVSVSNIEDAVPSTPNGLRTTRVTYSSISLDWNAAKDDMAVVGYNIFRNGLYVASTAGAKYTITGLNPLSSHNITVQAYDAVRNKSARSIALSVTTAAPPDVTAPSVPTNLTFSDLTGMSVIVRWNASTDNVGVTGYNVYVNGVYNKTVTNRVTTLTGLSDVTTYSIFIQAVDAGKNRSALSTALNLTTTDSTKPTAPTNVASNNVTKTSARVTWTAATDNILVTNHNIYRNGTYVATVSGTTTAYNLTGLTAGTTYNITVRALDAAKNFTNSTALSLTTLP
jgi:chitodextrinase